jgi:hypothetical protein
MMVLSFLDAIFTAITFSTGNRYFSTMNIQNTRANVFQGEVLSGDSQLVGLTALANALNLAAPKGQGPSCFTPTIS